MVPNNLIDFKIITELPDLNPGSVDRALDQFIEESDQYKVPADKNGTKQALIDLMASCLIFKNNPSHFIWTAVEDKELKAFAITNVSKAIDNNLTYFGNDAWLAKEYRNLQIAKSCFQKMREHAKKLMCKHFVVVSSRSPKAYLRFLGKQYHIYATLLKEDF